MVRTVCVRAKFGPVARTKGWTAAMRSAYQAGGPAPDPDGVIRDFRREPGEHRGQWLMLPPAAPEWARDPGELWAAAGKAEKRYDAQEARFMDVQWPRVLPLAIVQEVVGEIYRPFVAAGLAVQVDLHVKDARDGGPNPHLHATLSTRRLGAGGFEASKARDWNRWFRAEGGKRPLRHVAEAFARVCARHCIEAAFETRSNAELGRPCPEDRLPPSIIKGARSAFSRSLLDKQDRHRSARREWEAVKSESEAVSAEHMATLEERRMLLGRLPRLEPEFTERTTPQPLPDTAWANICEGLPFVTARPTQLMDGIMAIHVGEDTLLIDRGDCVLLDGPVDNDVAVVLHRMAMQKGWRTTILRDPSSATGDSDAAESEPALWFARRASGGTRPASEKVANGARTEASRPFLSPMGRLGYRCLVDALGADDGKGAALDGLIRRADEEGDAHFHELLQRMAVVALSCVPDPDETDLAALIETVAADEPPTAGGWAEWKMHLHLALVASSLPGRGLAPRPRRDEPPTHLLAAAAETI